MRLFMRLPIVLAALGPLVHPCDEALAQGGEGGNHRDRATTVAWL